MTKTKIVRGKFCQIKHVDNHDKNSKIAAVEWVVVISFVVTMLIYAIKSY